MCYRTFTCPKHFGNFPSATTLGCQLSHHLPAGFLLLRNAGVIVGLPIFNRGHCVNGRAFSINQKLFDHAALRYCVTSESAIASTALHLRCT